jgi:hypothetical protein
MPHAVVRQLVASALMDGQKRQKWHHLLFV